MKNYLIVILLFLFPLSIFSQNTFKYELRANGGLRVGGATFAKIDSITEQAGKLRIMKGSTLQKIAGHMLEADTATMLVKYARKASPTFTGIPKINTDTIATQAYARAYGDGSTPIDTTHLSTRIDLKLNSADTAAMLSGYALLSEVGSGASMVYPSGSGIPLVVSGSSWGTTITNNSTGWNNASSWVTTNGANTVTAYNWGNHASAGYALSSALSGYVPTSRTINSKALSSNISITATDISLGNVTNESKATMFTSPVFTGTIPRIGSPVTDTLATRAYSRSVSGGGTLTLTDVENAIDARISNGTSLSTVAVIKADSTGGPGHYASHHDMTTGLAGKQASSAILTSLAGLSNSSGVLTNNGSGTLSWAAAGGGEMIYPGAGIPVSTGSAWGTSVSSVSATELGYVDGVTSAIQTQLNSKAPLNITLNAQTGTAYTLVLSDAYKIVTMTNNSANTLTIPLNSSVAFPVGTQITVVQNGSGETTIAATGGVTLNSAEGKKDLRVQFSSCTIIKVATDTWLLIGDIEA